MNDVLTVPVSQPGGWGAPGALRLKPCAAGRSGSERLDGGRSDPAVSVRTTPTLMAHFHSKKLLLGELTCVTAGGTRVSI